MIWLSPRLATGHLTPRLTLESNAAPVHHGPRLTNKQFREWWQFPDGLGGPTQAERLLKSTDDLVEHGEDCGLVVCAMSQGNTHRQGFNTCWNGVSST